MFVYVSLALLCSLTKWYYMFCLDESRKKKLCLFCCNSVGFVLSVWLYGYWYYAWFESELEYPLVFTKPSNNVFISFTSLFSPLPSIVFLFFFCDIKKVTLAYFIHSFSLSLSLICLFDLRSCCGQTREKERGSDCACLLFYSCKGYDLLFTWYQESNFHILKRRKRLVFHRICFAWSCVWSWNCTCFVVINE